MNSDYKESCFTSADGQEIVLHEYTPKKKIINSLILVYEIFGKTNHFHKLASKLAENGILVYMPDIFSRLEKNIVLPYDKDGFKKGIEFKEKLGWELPVMDIVSCASILKQKYPVNIMGFCYGGTLSWVTIQKSFIFEKAVCYYGTSIPDFLIKGLNCSAMLHFGGKDQGIPKSSIEKVRKYIAKQDYKVRIFDYGDADHGFNCEDRKNYNENASKLAFSRSMDFLIGD